MRRFASALLLALPALGQNDPWTPATGLTTGTVSVLRSNDANRNVLWAGGSGGAFRSDDGGRTWAAMTLALPDASHRGVQERSLDVNRRDANDVIMGFGGHIYRTADGGRSWTPILNDVYTEMMLALDPKDARTFYVSTFGYDSVCWAKFIDGIRVLGDGCQKGIGVLFAIDPTNPDTLYGSSLLKSADGGASWNRLSPPFRVSFILVDGKGGVWIGGNSNVQARVAWSGDGGVTWDERSAGLPAAPSGHIWISDLAIDPGDASVIVAAVKAGGGDFGGFYRSVDGGRHWYPVGSHHEALAVAFGGADGEVLAGGLADGGVVVTNGRPPQTPISISSVLPDSGSVDGGTLLMIYGDGFTPWTWVTVGGREATDFTFFDAHTLRVRTPPGALGLADVAVHSATGSAATLPDAFHYVDWAAIPVSAGDGALALENGRFLVDAVWLDAPLSHVGQPVSVSQKSGYFWFDFPAAMDLVVKILDGRTVNGHYWIHWSVLSDRPVQFRVLDRVNPLNQRIYTKSGSGAAAGIDKTSF